MDKIYKYRALEKNISDTDNTVKLLKDNAIYFSEPKEFNDPFDSYIEFISIDTSKWLKDFQEKTKEEQEKYLERIGLSDDKIQKLKNIDIKKPNSFYPSKSLQKSSRLRILCFSEEADNMLLWSHYSEDHTGICIGFKVHSEYDSYCLHFNPDDLKIPDIQKGTISLFKVTYSEDMPNPYNIFEDRPERLIDFARTKSKCWEYEKEHRLIILDNMVAKNLIRFDPHEITDIIFGIKTEKKHKDKIRNIIDSYPNNGKWIKIHECSREKGKYKIKITQID